MNGANSTIGHTFGHALEKLTGIPHGEAVGIGMVLAANLSAQKGLDRPKADAQRLEKIIQSYGLACAALPVDASSMLAALRKDKKREGRPDPFCLSYRLWVSASVARNQIFGALARLAKAARIR